MLRLRGAGVGPAGPWGAGGSGGAAGAGVGGAAGGAAVRKAGCRYPDSRIGKLNCRRRAAPSLSVGGEPESACSWPMGALAIAIRTRLAAGDSAAQHSTV
jgi:hypothetical protein